MNIEAMGVESNTNHKCTDIEVNCPDLKKAFCQKLFRSTIWLSAWEQVWGGVVGVEYYREKDEPIQLGLYSYIAKKYRVFSMKTLVPYGLSSLAISSIRGEYFSFESKQVLNRFIEKLTKISWDRVYISDLIVGSPEYRQLEKYAQINNYSFLVRGYELSYGIDVRKVNFEGYLSCLGKNTRLKLYNRREKVLKQGSLEVKNIWPDIDSFIDLINGFHRVRWKKPCFSYKNELFIRELLANLNRAGNHVDLSVMYFNGSPVSAMMDLEMDGRVYNIQSGYIEDFMPGVSLGTLHFGYQIEAAFKDKKIDYYDFMAGKGKNSNYKLSMANSSEQFVSLLIVRNPIIKFLYRLNDLLKHNPSDLSGYIADDNGSNEASNPDRN